MYWAGGAAAIVSLGLFGWIAVAGAMGKVEASGGAGAVRVSLQSRYGGGIEGKVYYPVGPMQPASASWDWRSARSERERTSALGIEVERGRSAIESVTPEHYAAGIPDR